LLVGYLLLLGGDDPYHRVARQVAKQDPYHPEGKVDLGGKVHDGHRTLADAENPPLLRSWPEVLRGRLARGDNNVYQAE
jgi:hypothetical protein